MLANATTSVLRVGCIAAKLDTTIDQLRELLEQTEIRQLPVVDDDGKIVGLVSRRDLAHAAYQAGAKSESGSRELFGQRTVAHVMSRQVMSVEGADSDEAALQAMVAHRFHSIPVTQRGQLAGSICGLDFLKKVAYGSWPGHNEPIRHRMRSPGHTIDADDTLERAFEAAEWHAQEYVVAVRKYRPLGILSRTAMRLALYLESSEPEAQRMKAMPVHQLLQSLPVLYPESTLSTAALTLLEHRARVLPVVDRSRLLLGVLSEDNILQAMAELVNA
ncbi:MAG: CBS domain-containing protein [Pirellulales bacterium]|nr:CBS domain-containing protein [Pirellulales bacterium]